MRAQDPSSVTCPDVAPLPGSTGIAVSTWEAFSSDNIGLDAIDREIEVNVEKISEASQRGSQGQLVIGVGKITDLLTPPAVPTLPPSLVAVMVVPLWRAPGAETVNVLRIGSGAHGWLRHAGVPWP